jgi:hypothetical protein
MSDRLPSSYRDPSGFIFKKNDILYRQVNPIFFKEYAAVKDSGIYQELFDKTWLIPHEEIISSQDKIILKPQQIPFITYPYEWSFTQYKHAAQLTLRLQLYLLEHGFTLKDASAFNITFHNGKAIFIDSLSIEQYQDNEPWRALEQFNTHFFSVLLLSARYGSRYLKSLSHQINGVDLQDVSKLLSWKSRFHPVIGPHIHLLAKTNKTSSDQRSLTASPRLSKNAQIKMLKVLEMHISKMELKESTEWSAYYQQTNYDIDAFNFKKEWISRATQEIDISKVLDAGGNDGTFSNVLPASVKKVIVSDIDQAAIDQCYKNQLKSQDDRSIPMVIDLMQPSPAIGFENKERDSFINRVKIFEVDMTMALALIHHLTLTGNVPFEMSAAFFASLSPYLLIEFPDKQDSWVQYILESKRDARHLFEEYGISAFAKAYQQQFDIIKQTQIPGTHRTLFLMQRR